MIRWLALLAFLVVAAPARADMYPDASNAKLPDARTSLGIAPHVATNAALTSASTASYPSGVWRDDFAAGNGAPPLWYLPSGSACLLNGGNGDGGSQVKSSDNKCWLAVFPSAGSDLRQWGAVSNGNVDAILDAVIAYACASHVPVYIPLPAQPYKLAAAHVIGNGSATSFSTCNKVTLFSEPQYSETTSGTTPPQYSNFIWAGSAGVIPITLQGPASSINLKGIGIDCGNICSTGFKIVNTLSSEYGWLGVMQQKGPAYILTTTAVVNTWGGGLENDWFHDIFAAQPGTGGSGGQIGDIACVSGCVTAVISSRFDRLHWLYDGNTAGTYGLKLGLVTQSSFSGLQVVKLNGVGSNGVGIWISPPPGALGYPDDVMIERVISDTDVYRAGSGWLPVVGGLHIVHWGATQLAAPVATGTPLASGHENTWGETSKGDVFGTGPWSWTPGDISGAALSLTNATSIWLRTPHGCTLKVDVTYPTTSDPSGAIVGNVPAICTPAALEGEAAGFSTVGAPVGFFIDATARILIYNSNTGAAYTNAGLSGKRISGVLNIMTIK